MRSHTWLLILYSQLLLYGGLLTCILLLPHGLVANSGISYYGTFLRTILPYCLGLLGAAYCIWLASYRLGSNTWLTISLRLMAILISGIVLTPYSLNAVFNWIHTILGSLLFIIQLIMSSRLAFWQQHSLTCIGLWLTEFASGIVSAFYVTPPKGYLIESQVIFQIAFGCLLLYVLGLKQSDKNRQINNQ